MLSIDVDTAALARQKDTFGATDKQFDTARLRTLRKTQRFIETAIKREASKELNIPQKSIADRFFTNKLNPGDEELTVWVGVWAVDPFSIGRPTQSRAGVRAGRRSYPGAFLAEIYSAQQKVWIRLHSPYYSPELYPTKKRPGNRGGQQSGRFPVVRAAVPIDAVVARVLSREADSFARQFETIFIRELNYEVNVKGQ